MTATAGLAHSFLKELLQGVHSFCQDSAGNVTPARSAGATDTFMGALLLDSSTATPTSFTAYSAVSSGEVSGTGYTAGGAALTIAAGQAVTNSNSGCVTPSASLSWTGLTLSTAFSALAIYNSSQGNRGVSLHTFGAQTITAGTLTLTMPTNAAGTALIELAGTA